MLTAGCNSRFGTGKIFALFYDYLVWRGMYGPLTDIGYGPSMLTEWVGAICMWACHLG